MIHTTASNAVPFTSILVSASLHVGDMNCPTVDCLGQQ